MAFDIPAVIGSPEQLMTVIEETGRYADWYFHETVKQQAGGSRSDVPRISAETSETIRSWFTTDKPTRQGFDRLVKALQRRRLHGRQVTITLAAAAPKAVRTSLVEWFRRNLSPDTLVSFQIDSTLLGGMVVRTGSRVFDWSFRRRIEDHKRTFPEVLRRV